MGFTMEIHIVQPGETIQTIALRYGVSVDSLIQNNDITNPNNLRIGQSIVIIYPELVYKVKDGDTLENIAEHFNVTLLQLLANNPYLSERDYIYPGDTIIITYNRKGKITTHGNAISNVDIATLRKTLPYLTYLSILNYTATSNGDLVPFSDDSKIIELSKNYGVVPLMLLTTVTIQGKANIRAAFEILLNEEKQNKLIDNILYTLREKGYFGVNISFQYISETNLFLYESFLEKVTTQLNEAGFQVFVIVNPNITAIDDEVDFQPIDYSLINELAQNIIFMTYEWAANASPPGPISSIFNIEVFLNYILNFIPSENIIIGIATIGYDWEFPYAPGITSVNSISFKRINDFASNYGVVIDFDELSQTPFFNYTDEVNINHVVWFINAISINASLELVTKYDLKGISIWNISIFNPQLWLIVNSQFEIEKIM